MEKKLTVSANDAIRLDDGTVDDIKPWYCDLHETKESLILSYLKLITSSTDFNSLEVMQTLTLSPKQCKNFALFLASCLQPMLENHITILNKTLTSKNILGQEVQLHLQNEKDMSMLSLENIRLMALNQADKQLCLYFFYY